MKIERPLNLNKHLFEDYSDSIYQSLMKVVIKEYGNIVVMVSLLYLLVAMKIMSLQLINLKEI